MSVYRFKAALIRQRRTNSCAVFSVLRDYEVHSWIHGLYHLAYAPAFRKMYEVADEDKIRYVGPVCDQYGSLAYGFYYHMYYTCCFVLTIGS